MQLVGRTSSHYTRLARIFAEELGVPIERVPILDMTADDPAVYAGNPALRLPVLRVNGTALFGALNICRALAEHASKPARIVWPEDLTDVVSRNAQELVWHCMGAQVQIVFGTVMAKLPAENLYFTKARSGMDGSLRWLDEHVAQILQVLPPDRTLSVIETSLFCMIEHLAWRRTVDIAPYAALVRYAQQFSQRPSAQHTPYDFDK